MKRLIDRTRWPALVTFSDEGEGHDGYVYRCSGWTPTERNERPIRVDDSGARRSSYSNGRHGSRDLVRAGTTTIQRWEHHVCPPASALTWMESAGWRRVAIEGKRWASGAQAYTYVRTEVAE